jgi:sensor histidine kinase regulating citrate/malate metabolism
LANAWQGVVVTDVQLLARVLGNMLKNALEASGPGDTVTLRCFEENDEVVFSVHNAAVMPREVQLQVFHRSFSTKGGPGRGIGTHSMKLLGERYLRGKVDFTSEHPYGTTFRIAIPKEPELASTGEAPGTLSSADKTAEESLSRK